MSGNISTLGCDQPIKGINLVSFSTSIKLLFTGYLTTVAIGYLIAMIQILLTHGMADGKFGLSLDDIVYSYYGNRSGSLLESKLNGSMRANAPEHERLEIIKWARDGASEQGYVTNIKPIIDKNCVMCHNAGADSIPDFSNFENLKKTAGCNEGKTLQTLIRVSHIHLFGISFIFLPVCLIFSFSTGVPRKYKYTAIIMPYLFLLVDIASWWLTRLNPNFAILVVLAGTGLGLTFFFMWCVSIYQMWFLGAILKTADARNALLAD